MVHVLVSRDGEVYVAECLEVAVVTQGRTLDELIANLKEAVSLHLEGQTMPRLSVILDVPAVVDARKT
ncbi:MAG: type II toxin-antitoxin system HicB family antitoxin [bacterium]